MIIKRLLFSMIIALSSLAVSCDMSTTEDDFSRIQDGAIMYSYTAITQLYAMDGVNVVMRLGILLNEMEAAGLEFELGTNADSPDWSQLGDILYANNGLYYNKKNFLFGEDKYAKIRKPDGNNYTITYGNTADVNTSANLYYGGVNESLYRDGEFNIYTNGVDDLTETSFENRWTIFINSIDVSYGMKGDSAEVISSARMEVNVWYASDGTFQYEFVDTELYSPTTETTGKWSAEGYVKVDNYTDLTVEETIKNNFEVTTSDAFGYAITGDYYTYNTSSPLIFNYTSMPALQIGGYENVTLVDGGSYGLPSYEVAVETLSTGNRIYYYNGYEYEQIVGY